ncbi:MAG: diphosphomevalonate decarboxylase [Bacteroidota bacterium]
MELKEKTIEKALIEYRSPSNIALVKYWGKMGLQMPMNPSVSFTLNACATTTCVEFNAIQNDRMEVQFEFFFEGAPKPDFHPKLNTFFDRILRDFPALKNYHLRLDSSNSFPHSSGIASSASAMSALALCLGEFEKKLLGEQYASDFDQRISNWSRLGSGSACRSVIPELGLWGYSPDIEGSSDKYAIAIDGIAPVFKDFRDIVLLVDKGEKQISSTAGHALMNGHAYTAARIEQAHLNLIELLDTMRNGNLEKFVKIVENEALSLHAMMLSSDPGYFLFKPETLKIIEAIRSFRQQNGIHLCFTLDAGANVHLLYPSKDEKEVLGFVEGELLVFCQNGEYICDSVGKGPERLKAQYD